MHVTNKILIIRFTIVFLCRQVLFCAGNSVHISTDRYTGVGVVVVTYCVQVCNGFESGSEAFLQCPNIGLRVKYF